NRVPAVLEIPGANVDWSASEESARSHTAIDRDTYRMVGPTDRYASDAFRLEITYVPASRPSKLLNAMFGGLVGAVWSRASGQTRPADALTGTDPARTEHVMMRERVLVPRVTQYTDTPVAQPAPAAVAANTAVAPAPAAPAVTQVAPAADPAAQIAADPTRVAFEVTPENVLRRQVHVASINHTAIRELADQALESFTRNNDNLGQRSRGTGGTVSRLLRADGGGLAGFLNAVSFPRLTRASRYALGPEGYVSPALVREGGALTDTDGRVRIRYAFYDGRPLDWVPSYLYSETYHFDESEAVDKAGRSVGGGVFGGPIIRTGERDPAPDSVAANRSTNAFFSGSLGGGHEISEVADSKRLRGTFRNRETEYLRVRAGIMVELEIDAHDQRAIVGMPRWAQRIPYVGGLARYADGGTTRLMFRIDDAAELLVDPETARERGIQHELGHPVPAGRHFPADNEAAPTATPAQAARVRRDRLAQAYALPSLLAPTPYPGGPPTPAQPGGTTGLYTLTIGGLDPVTRTVTYGGQQYDVAGFAALVRSLPDWHGRSLVLAAGGAAQPHPDGAGHTSFAAELSTALNVDVLATPDDVYQDAHGRVRAARFALGADGRPVPGGFRPGNWVLHHPAVPNQPAAPPTVHGEDLIDVARTELPAASRIEPRPAPPAVFAPAQEVGWAGSTVPVDELGGRLADAVDLGNGLAATRHGTGAVVIGRAGVAPPAAVPGLVPAPGSTTVVVTDPAVRADALLLSLARLLPVLPAGQRDLRLVLPGGAATGAANSFAQHAAGRLLVDVVAHDGNDPRTGQWTRFRRNAAPVPVGNQIAAAPATPQPGLPPGPPPGLPPGPGSLGGGRGWFFGSRTGDPALVAAARAALPQFPGAYVAAAHTTADGQRIVLGDGRQLTPEQFVTELAGSTDYVAGTPLVLVACQAGATPAGGTAFAAAVGHALPTPADVWAADTDVWQTSDGRVIATPTVLATPTGPAAAGVQLRPRFGPDRQGTGNWLRFPAATAAAPPAPVGPAPGGPGPVLPAVVGAPTSHGADLVTALAPTTVPSRQPGQTPADFRWAVLTQAQLTQIQQAAAGQQVLNAVAALITPIAAARAALPGFPNAYVVAGHMTGDGQRMVTAIGQLTPAQFVQQLAGNTDYVSGTPLVLVACQAGAAPGDPLLAAVAPAFAAEVRRLLPVPADVWAADTDVWQTRDGRVLATPTDVTAAGGVRPRFGPTGQPTGRWLRFPARTVLAAPAPAGPTVAPVPPAQVEPAAEQYGAELVTVLTTEAPPRARQPGVSRPAGRVPRDYRWRRPLTPAELAAVQAAGMPGVAGQQARFAQEYQLRATAAATAAAQPPADPPAGLIPSTAGLDPTTTERAMGERGRLRQIGPIALGGPAGDAAVAALARDAVPAAQPGRRQQVHDGVSAEFRRLGTEVAGQSLLQDGLRFTVTDGGQTFEARVWLRLPNPANPVFLPTEQAERGQVRLGEKRGTGADQTHEQLSGRSFDVGVGRSGGIQPQTGFGAPGTERLVKVGPVFGASLTGASKGGWGTSDLAVISAMKQLDFDGASSYFTVDGAVLRVDLQEVGVVPAPAPVSHQSPAQQLRLDFPTETTPPAGPPGPVHRPLGIDGRDHVAATPGTPAPTAAQEREAAAALSRIFAVAESVGGLDGIRRAVLAAVPGAGAGFRRGVRDFLRESTVLKAWQHVAGSGFPSSWLPLGGRHGDRGAGLQLTARLRSVQRVDEGPTPPDRTLKIESRQGVQVGTGESGGGSAGLGFFGRTGLTFEDTDFGHGWELGSVGGQVGTSTEAGRSLNQAIGGGEWRTASVTGPTRLYRAIMQFDADILSDLPGASQVVSADGEVFLRVPEREGDRFEALMRHVTDPTTVVPANDVDPPAPAGPPPALRPPDEVEADAGIGLASIDRLAGAEQVAPRIEQAIQDAEQAVGFGLADWTPRQRQQLRRELMATYSPEAMNSGSSRLVGRRGLRQRYRRVTNGGTEVITIRVRPRRRPGPAATVQVPRQGRVANGGTNAIPTFFADIGASESLAATFSGSGSGVLSAPIGQRTDPTPAQSGAAPNSELRTFGAGGDLYSYSRSQTAGESTGVFSFGVRGALPEGGPLVTFDYDVNYEISVDVEYFPGMLSPRWLNLWGRRAGRWAGQLWRPPAGPRFAPHTARVDVLRNQAPAGSIRYVLPEAAAPVTGTPVAANLGASTVGGRGSQGRPTDVATPVTSDDIVSDVLGSDDINDAVTGMLEGLGYTTHELGGTVDAFTSAANLRAHLLRDPTGPLTMELPRGGAVTTRRGMVVLRPRPVNAAQGTQQVNLSRLDIIESQPKIEGTDRRAGAHILGGRGEFGTEAFDRSPDGSQVLAVPTLTGKHAVSKWAAQSKEADTAVTGRWITRPLAPYDEHAADVIWDISVVSWNENLLSPGRAAEVPPREVRTDGGLRFYRPAPAAPAGPPPGVPAAVTARQLPKQTVNERIEFLTPAEAAALPAAVAALPAAVAANSANVQGGVPVNPVLAAVRRLLLRHSAGLTTRRFELVNGAGQVIAQGGLPKLEAMLSQGSLLGHIDLMLGSGLLLRPMRSWPFWISRPQLLLRANRPAGAGAYQYEASYDNYSMGRYWTDYQKTEGRDGQDREGASSLGGRVLGIVPNPTDAPGAPPRQPGDTADHHRGDPGEVVPTGLGILGATRTTTETDESAVGTSAVMRDTYRHVGPADAYGSSQLELEITYLPASRPSKWLNSILAGIPAAVWSYAGNQRHPDQLITAPAADRVERVWVKERVIVPRRAQYTDTPGVTAATVTLAPAPPPVVVVAVANPAATLPATITAEGRVHFPVSQDELRERRIHLYDIDHQAVRQLSDQALGLLTGRTQPGSSAPARLLQADGSGLAGLLTTLSYPRLTRGAYQAVGPDGYQTPDLLREGGAVTDTIGNATVRYAFYDAQPLDFIPSYMYSEAYHIEEEEQQQKGARSVEASVFGGPQFTSGDVDAPGNSPANNQTSTYFSGALSGSHSYGEMADYKQWRGVFRNRQTDYLRARAGLMVSIEVDAANLRAFMQLPQWAGNRPLIRYLRGGRAEVVFRADNAVELLVDPQTAAGRGLRHEQGYPTAAGRHFPGPGQTAGAAVTNLTDAQALPNFRAPAQPAPPGTPTPPPAFHGWYTVSAGGFDPVTQTINVDGTDLTAAGFAARLRAVPEWAAHQYPVVLSFGGAGHVPAGGAAFAAGVAAALGSDVLATPDDVWQLPDGRVLAARFALGAGGAPVRNQWRPGNWVRYPAAGGPPAVFSDDLHEVITTELPAGTQITPQPPLPATFPPVAPGGSLNLALAPPPVAALPVGATVPVGAGLDATAVGTEIHLHPSGPPLGAAGMAAGHPAEPNRATVVVDPAATPDQVLVGLGRVLAALPAARQGSIRLVMPGAGTGGPAALGQQIADRYGIEVLAPDGPVRVAGGSFVQVRANPLAQWQRFSRYDPPLPSGALGPNAPGWQPALQGALTALHGPAGPAGTPAGTELVRVPAGVLLTRPGNPVGLGHPVDPTAVTLLADPTITDAELAGYLTPAVVAQYTAGGTAVVLDPRRPAAAFGAAAAAALANATTLPVLRRHPVPAWPALSTGQLHRPGPGVASGRPVPAPVAVLSPALGPAVTPGVWPLLAAVPANAPAGAVPAGTGWEVEVTQSGLWVRPPNPTQAESDAAHAVPADPNRMRVLVESPGNTSAPGPVWNAVTALAGNLTVGGAAVNGGQVTVATEHASTLARDRADQLRGTGATLTGSWQGGGNAGVRRPLGHTRGLYIGPAQDSALLAQAADALPRFPHAYVVAAHATADRRAMVGENGQPLPMADLATQLAADPAYQDGTPIVLVVCGAAGPVEGGPIGQQLRNELAARGIPADVLAATTDVWQAADGTGVVAGTQTFDPFGRPVLNRTGQWRLYAGTPQAGDRTVFDADLVTAITTEVPQRLRPPAGVPPRPQGQLPANFRWADGPADGRAEPAEKPADGRADRADPAAADPAGGRADPADPVADPADPVAADAADPAGIGPAVQSGRWWPGRASTVDGGLVGWLAAQYDQLSAPGRLLDLTEAHTYLSQLARWGSRRRLWTTPVQQPPPAPMLYHGWMYAPGPLTQQAALSQQAGHRLVTPGFLVASADPGAVPPCPVLLAIHGSALDVSELNGMPRGSVLLIAPGTAYTIIGIGWDPARPGTVRITATD
ncbi:MAG: hypothetical protein V7637_627, partial [Mycobacteriales bacterium]